MDSVQLYSTRYLYFSHELTNLIGNIDLRLANINIQAYGPGDLTERYIIVVDILFESLVYCSFSL